MPIQTQFPITFSRKGINLPKENLLFLFDPSNGVFTDTSMTVRAQEGQNIRSWKDLSVNSYHVTQPGATSLLPTYRASVFQLNNKPAVEFGGDDYLFRSLSTTLLGNIDTYTIYIVYRTTQTGGEVSFFSEGVSSGNNPRVNSVIADGRIRHFHSDGTTYTAGTGHASNLNNGEARLLTVRRISNASWEWQSQNWTESIGSTAVGTMTTAQFSLGCWLASTATGFLNGQIALLAAYSSDNANTLNPIIQNYFSICNTYFLNTEKYYFTVGDSKTVGWIDPELECGGFGYQPHLSAGLTTTDSMQWRDLSPRAAHGGFTTLGVKNVIDADLALVSNTPEAVLIELGTNDHSSFPTEADWKSNITYIISACHTKWPSAKLYLAKPVALNATPPSTPVATCATLWGWIDDIVALYAYVYAGMDETTLEGGDNYATNFIDNFHPNGVGNETKATQWQTAMGY